MAVAHKYTIVCEEVRREDNGKLLLLGVYNFTVLVPVLPFVLPSLTFVLFLEADRQGHCPMNFKLQHVESGKTLLEGHGAAVFGGAGPAIVPMKLGNMQLQAVGLYSFLVEIAGLDPIITQFNVSLKITVEGQK